MNKAPLKSKKLRESARGQSCIRCGTEDGTVCLRHINGGFAHAYGKGRGIKAHDLASAEFCNECDQLFSESNYHKWEGGAKSIDRSDMFSHFIMLTNIRRMERGVLKIA